MTNAATTQETGTGGKARSALLLSLAMGAALSAVVALAGTAREAEATFPGTNGRIAFASEGTTGAGVDNPTGDYEIFTIKPDGTGLKQLTFNTVHDSTPVFSPDGTKIAYESAGTQTSNPEGDADIYLMNAVDGSGQINLTNTGNNIRDSGPVFSPVGQWIAYSSDGNQTSNPEGDLEVYVMNALDGSAKKNLTNDGAYDEFPDWGRRTT
jgi:Tol biopolymer transport system component